MNTIKIKTNEAGEVVIIHLPHILLTLSSTDSLNLIEGQDLNKDTIFIDFNLNGNKVPFMFKTNVKRLLDDETGKLYDEINFHPILTDDSWDVITNKVSTKASFLGGDYIIKHLVNLILNDDREGDYDKTFLNEFYCYLNDLTDVVIDVDYKDKKFNVSHTGVFGEHDSEFLYGLETKLPYFTLGNEIYDNFVTQIYNRKKDFSKNDVILLDEVLRTIEKRMTGYYDIVVKRYVDIANGTRAERVARNLTRYLRLNNGLIVHTTLYGRCNVLKVGLPNDGDTTNKFNLLLSVLRLMGYGVYFTLAASPVNYNRTVVSDITPVTLRITDNNDEDITLFLKEVSYNPRVETFEDLLKNLDYEEVLNQLVPSDALDENKDELITTLIDRKYNFPNGVTLYVSLGSKEYILTKETESHLGTKTICKNLYPKGIYSLDTVYDLAVKLSKG